MTTTLKATGYDPNEYFFATRYQQGGRTVYSLDFSVRELVTFLPKPDPDKPLDVNATQRRITPIHARDFELAPWWCPDCGATYCGEHWETWDVFDPDEPAFHDGIRGRCPQGHERLLED